MQARAQRVACDAGLLALLAVAAAAVAADLAVLRPIAVLPALLLVPGGAVLTCLRIDDTGTAAGVAIGLSLAIATLLAGALAAAGALEPWALAAALGPPAVVLLAVDLVRAAGEPSPVERPAP